MRIAILHNLDFTHIADGVARRSQDAVLDVVGAFDAALRRRGAEVKIVPIAAEPVDFLGELRAFGPEVVVNLTESLAGDARGEMLVPALLDLLGERYTGSGPLALTVALHKDKAKALLRGCGVCTPAWGVVERMEQCEALEVPLPAIVKPAREDASIGIDRHSVVHDHEALRRACERVLREHHQPALVEQFIAGRELNVALFGDAPQVLPINEIDFSALPAGLPRIVTYAAKWDESSPEYLATPPVRCRLPADVEARVRETARAAFTALDCRDYGRVDIRLSEDGVPYVIEVNPNCDLSPDAGFAKAALAAGVDHESLVWRLVEMARARPAPRRTHRPGGTDAN